MKHTKEQLTNYLVKRGFNKNDAVKMVEVNFDYVQRVYPSATVKQKCEVISTLGF
jgi:hypothetical protein